MLPEIRGPEGWGPALCEQYSSNDKVMDLAATIDLLDRKDLLRAAPADGEMLR
jgi:hypothetical protein